MKKSRPFFERIVWISKELRSGKSLNCSRIAEHFECTTKTAFRDIEFLRDRLGYDFEYDPCAHSFRLLSDPPRLL